MKTAEFSLLPGDLVIIILSLLPVKSLLRFKCVCKSWYDLFINPNFISKHIVNSSNNHRLILGYHDVPNEGGDFRILDNNTLDVIVPDFRFDSFHRQVQNWGENGFETHQRLMGSYNGLVCAADLFLKDFAFWNPATRQFKIVNQSNKIKHKRTEHAFGYDFKTNDYKVMRITPLTKGKYDQIEVYSFYSDSWKTSNAVIPDGICFDRARKRLTICVKGFYSTMAYTVDDKDSELRNYFMFTIDMSNETFILTQVPEKGVNFEVSGWENKVLTELKKSVAFINYQAGPSVDEKSFEIFTLNEYGPNGIWTKLYTIALGFWPRTIGFWKNEELFLIKWSGGSGCLVSFDLRTLEQKKKLAIYGVSMQILEYKESLVWINDRRFLM